MSDLDSSSELLSTMSPRITSKRKYRKSPTKLALKKNFRKSVLFDRKPKYDLDNSIILIEDTIEGEDSFFTIQKNKNPDIISLSSEYVSDSLSESSKSDCAIKSEDRNMKNTISSVDRWLSDNEKAGGYTKYFSFNNDVASDDDLKTEKNQIKFDDFNISDDDRIFDKTGIRIFHSTINEDLQLNAVNVGIKKGPEDLRSSISRNKNCFSDKILSSPSRKETESNGIVNSSFEDQREAYENILDDIYGKSWRNKKDDILPKSEKKPPKPKTNIQMPKTERKPAKNVNNNHKKPLLTPLQQKLKLICDSDTESDTTESYKNPPNERLSFSDSDSDRPLKVPPKSVKKKNNTNSRKLSPKNNKKYSSSSKSELNFSDSDNDSLETRVRKKMVKKPKDLQEFANTPKTKLKLKENGKILDDKENNKVNRKVEGSKTTSKKKENGVGERAVTKNVKSKEVIKENADKDGGKGKQFSFLYSLNDCLPSWQTDPNGRFYRDNFKTHKDILLKKLFELFNEKIFDNAIPQDSPIEWNDRIRQTAGFCYNRRITRRNGTVERHCRIVLAPKILDRASRLRDTLVHEMCHAATWIVNNVADGHGPYWKAWAQKAMKVFPELPPIKRCHDYVINYKYTFKCMECGYSIGRHTKSLNTDTHRCGYCHGKFEVFINKTTKGGEQKTVPITPRGKGQPTGFALFVKENYNSVKRPDLKHGEVMKLLGQQFSALKIAKTT